MFTIFITVLYPINLYFHAFSVGPSQPTLSLKELIDTCYNDFNNQLYTIENTHSSRTIQNRVIHHLKTTSN